MVVGTNITTLDVHGTQSGVFPYSATVMPLMGQVPLGYTVKSTDDSALQASVLSRWSDGSAAVMVVAGMVTIGAVPGTVAPGGQLDRKLTLQLAQDPAAVRSVRPPARLTAARIAQLVNSVKVDFGTALGAASITNLSSPERIWWANAQTICARYRAGVSGHPSLEAVVDIHAYAGSTSALVEVVVENCKFAAASSTTASLPGSASYTATVSVNGTQVTSVNSNGGPEGTHAGLRAWYASYWVGGDPGLRVTQLHTDLQQHPLFWKMARNSTADLSGYAGDNYVPWGAGRHRGVNMGGTGDHPSIGFLTLWDAQFLQSGDARVAKASEANALAILGYNINYRDSVSGLVPDAAVLKRKSQTGYFKNWPRLSNPQERMTWEVAHHPAAGLMAFVCRPSPVYIEIAQKIAVWNATYGADSTGLSGWQGTWPDTDYTGVFSSGYQIRGRAWSIRSLNHALFLSPEGSAWKEGAKYWLDRARLYLSGWQNHPQAILNVMWDDAPNSPTDHQNSQPAFQSPVWEYHWLICELHRSASAKFLTGPQQAALVSLADWTAMQPVRWINEQPNGGWRYLPYTTTIGGTTPINSLPTWGAQIAPWRIGDPPTVNGEWMTSYTQGEPAAWTDYRPDTVAAGYTMQFYAALVTAVERQLTGASNAWSTVANGITTPDWQDRFGADPRWGSVPKVLPLAAGWGTGTDVGSISGDLWIPGRDADGVINAASVATLTRNRWYRVASSRFDSLAAQMAPGWVDRGGATFDVALASWVGWAVDFRAGLESAYVWAPGGHYASSNNGIYKVDFRRMTWGVEMHPTHPQYFESRYNLSWISQYPPVPYSGSFTGYPAAYQWWSQGHQTIETNPLQIGFDEIYDPAFPNDPNRSSRMRTSVHTYSGPVFVPDANGSGGRILDGTRRFWTYNTTTKRQAARFPFNNPAGGAENGYGGENTYGWVNTTEGRYYFAGTQENGSRKSWSVTYDGTSFRWEGFWPTGGYPGYFSRVTQLGNKLWTLMYADQTAKPLSLLESDVLTRQQTVHPITLGTSLTNKTWPLSRYNQSAPVYVPQWNKWLCIIDTHQDGEVLGIIDGSTYVLERATIPGAVPEAGGASMLIENRWNYLPTLGVVVACHKGNTEMRVMVPA